MLHSVLETDRKRNVVPDSAKFQRYPLSSLILISTPTAIVASKTLTPNMLIRTMSYESAFLSERDIEHTARALIVTVPELHL